MIAPNGGTEQPARKASLAEREIELRRAKQVELVRWELHQRARAAGSREEVLTGPEWLAASDRLRKAIVGFLEAQLEAQQTGCEGGRL